VRTHCVGYGSPRWAYFCGSPWKLITTCSGSHGRFARSSRTTAALVSRLGWPREQWTQAFQSLFGRDRWLKPYTEEVLTALAKRGATRVFVAMPGFTADCLETIDEIGREARETFEHAGGAALHACPCLNDHPAWIDAMARIVRAEGTGWLPS
jgi:ferrochelatase